MQSSRYRKSKNSERTGAHAKAYPTLPLARSVGMFTPCVRYGDAPPFEYRKNKNPERTAGCAKTHPVQPWREALTYSQWHRPIEKDARNHFRSLDLLISRSASRLDQALQGANSGLPSPSEASLDDFRSLD
uniref:Uncharacterized protein n=1 Tax=Candidatus Kentrum sp. LFY TaxID=2126342 RepID=A0A450UCX1_9GAMM|nr:MAG: hypothetical protein BECKLFY1418A_GA0070994_10114 [Candidatus Kentron sp. LFY]